MNNVNLIGRLTRDPALTEYGKGKNAGLLARFTVAVRRDADNADFISCVAFGKTAELIDEYFSKGSQIGITGSIQTGKYEDKDGDTHYTTDVVARQIDFVGSKKDDEEDEEKPRKKSGKTSAKTSAKKSSRRRKVEDDEEEEDDEEDPEFIDPNDLDDELPFV